MATPRPSSVAIVGAVVGKVRTEVSRPSRDRPAPTLKTADTSGIAAAMSEPNMNSSRRRPHPRPISSDVVSLCVAPMLAAAAPYSTSSPAVRAGPTAALSRPR